MNQRQVIRCAYGALAGVAAFIFAAGFAFAWVLR
jgi:hypothetical protein